MRLWRAIVVTSVTGLLLPLVLATQANAPSAAVLAALAVALAAVLLLVSHVAGLVPNALASVPHASADVLSLLAGRVTDPQHHPLRPRAPGLV